jgi:hypothetical protein
MRFPLILQLPSLNQKVRTEEPEVAFLHIGRQILRGTFVGHL